MGGSGATASVKLSSENLPARSFQTGAATKTWTFTNGSTAITGLKAVAVATDSGLGITATQVVLGDVAANASFTVSLPVNPSHSGAAVKSSTWKLVDGSGAAVHISNSKTGQFWLKLLTNNPPLFSAAQLDSVGAKANASVSLPVLAGDADSDALNFTASSGTVTNGVWSGSFATAGIQTVTITASDGIDSVTKNISVVVGANAGYSRTFADVLPGAANGICDTSGNLTNSADYADIQYLYLHGVVIGLASGNSRIFQPCRTATQAEALKMLMEAAKARGWVSFDEPSRVLGNLMVTDSATGYFTDDSWATPYVLKAETLGIIPAAATFASQTPATRGFVLKALAHLLKVILPSFDLSAAAHFTDESAFVAADLNDARAAAFYGLMGSFGASFLPDAGMIRSHVAKVAARITGAGLLGAPVLADSLAATPITLPPAPGGNTRTTVEQVTLVLEDAGGVKSAYAFNYGVLIPDRDGDGVRDSLDLWPDNALFSADANSNGIPDNVDAALGTSARNGTDAVTVSGAQTTIAQAVTAGNFTGLASALVQTQVDGSCGVSQGSTLAVAPTGNLCAAGAASGVSGNGPWAWSCQGSNGGVNASCSANKAVAPGAPTIGIATPGNGSATVNFTAPTSAGSSAITGYTVTSNPAGGVDVNAGSTVLTHTVTGLSNGISYTFTVVAANSVGAGAASIASSAVMPHKASQSIGTISFSPATLAVGGTATVSAAASSGLAASFSSTTPGVFRFWQHRHGHYGRYLHHCR